MPPWLRRQKENNQGNNETEIGTYHWSRNAALMLQDYRVCLGHQNYCWVPTGWSISENWLIRQSAAVIQDAVR